MSSTPRYASFLKRVPQNGEKRLNAENLLPAIGMHVAQGCQIQKIFRRDTLDKIAGHFRKLQDISRRRGGFT